MATRKCPQCAETIQAEAAVCRHCGHRFTPEEVEAWHKQQSRSSLVTGVIVVLVLGVLIYSCSSGSETPDGQSARRTAPCNLEAAGKMMQLGVEHGIVRRTTERGMIVDEEMFMALDFDLKRKLAEARACQIGAGEMADTYVSIRSNRTDAIIASGIPGSGTFSVKD